MASASASAAEVRFNDNYQTHLKHLKLKGLQPKTIEAYSRAIRRSGDYFKHQIDDLCEAQLTDYFTDLLASHSWTTVKLDLYGLKFYYAYVIKKSWPALHLLKPPKVGRLPDIVTISEAGRLFATTRVLSYRVLFFTLYSLGLRLGEGLRLQVGDIDATRQRVHIRDAKGNKDRLVPLPQVTLEIDGLPGWLRAARLSEGRSAVAPARLARLVQRAGMDDVPGCQGRDQRASLRGVVRRASRQPAAGTRCADSVRRGGRRGPFEQCRAA